MLFCGIGPLRKNIGQNNTGGNRRRYSLFAFLFIFVNHLSKYLFRL